MSATDELKRVRHNIADLILTFCRTRQAPVFFMRDLHDYILAASQIAPASADRVLRDLRARGLVNYRVIHRRNSQYELLPARKRQLELIG